MEEEASISLDGKVLANMRVIDLKLELEKRGLSKSGSKKDLVKRLKQQLEFEKLCEERKSGDFDPRLELDAEIQQNEFVQQYLAQQQKRYAERKEEKRLELEAMEKHCKEDSSVKCKSQDEAGQNAVSDSDETSNEKQTITINPSMEESLNESEANAHVSKKEPNKSEEKLSCFSETEQKSEVCQEQTSSPSSIFIENVTEKEMNKKDQGKIDRSDSCNENIINAIDASNIQLSKPLSQSVSKVTSPISSEHDKKELRKTDLHKDKTCDSDSIEKHDPEVYHNIQSYSTQVKDQKTETVFFEIVNKDQKSPNKLHSSDILNTECDEINSSISEEVRKSSCHTSLKRCSSDHLEVNKELSRNMDKSECSPVPYSLSDIQLPESPGRNTKSKDMKEAAKSKTDLVSDKNTEENASSSNKTKSNGEAAHDINSSYEDEKSESEKKKNNSNNDSPEKSSAREDIKSGEHSDESSDVESDRNSSSYKKKSSKSENKSSNIGTDSDEDQPKSTVNKNQKSLKVQQTDESDNDKSSDSEKYSHRSDSKHKSRDKRRKGRDRQSRSSSSISSSSSHSSDNRSKRRHSKKSIITKSKSFTENNEKNRTSDRSSDEKSQKHKSDSAIKPSSVPHTSPKKRFKIKRDNVSVKLAPVESLEKSSSSKDVEKSRSSSHSQSDKPSQESIVGNEPIDEITYKQRILVLNRKLNRNVSEDKSEEPKSKKGKWANFASDQKKLEFSKQTAQKISISADSLKDWFPNFMLSEPSSSMELEQEDHSLSTPDEKNMEISHVEVSNESGVKQESTSQIDIEDSESQEPNFEDTSEVGPASKIIFIQNLVRPFTLNQLKDLIKSYGKTIEEYFWIDKIKSKCFVMYETEKEAIKARNALNNTRWPSSNPKILSVEFSSEEELEQHKKGSEPPSVKPPEPPAADPVEVVETRISHPVEEHKRKDRERRKDRDRSKTQLPVREWDKDKIMQDSPEREHVSKEEKSRSSEKKEKKESKKRATEDTPAKLLDDLFQKTKNPPCIYWLPLTEEQAKQKEEAQKMRRLEREKRNQQLKEQEEAERRSRRARSSRRSREKENRKSSTRSRSPLTRRR